MFGVTEVKLGAKWEDFNITVTTAGSDTACWQDARKLFLCYTFDVCHQNVTLYQTW